MIWIDDYWHALIDDGVVTISCMHDGLISARIHWWLDTLLRFLTARILSIHGYNSPDGGMIYCRPINQSNATTHTSCALISGACVLSPKGPEFMAIPLNITNILRTVSAEQCYIYRVCLARKCLVALMYYQSLLFLYVLGLLDWLNDCLIDCLPDNMTAFLTIWLPIWLPVWLYDCL